MAATVTIPALATADSNWVMPTKAREVLHNLASEWNDVASPEALEVVPLKGAEGMAMNKVFEVKWRTNNPQDGGEDGGVSHRKVLLRIYGEQTESFFDRGDEIRVFEAVSRQGQGPRLLGTFDNGRVEEFIHGRTLSSEDLRDPEISAIIATKLRKFHDLDMPGPKKVHIWNQLKTWSKKAKSLSSPEEAKEFHLDIIGEDISNLENELSSKEQMIAFCHNDLWYGNIMMDEKTNMLTIIDYETACFNPVAYEMANYFCEMVGNFDQTPYIVDFNKYPNFEERKRFVQIYLSSSCEGPKEMEVETLLELIEKYVLVGHLYCGLGMISMGRHADVHCMEYIKQRFQQYWLRKTRTID